MRKHNLKILRSMLTQHMRKVSTLPGRHARTTCTTHPGN